jgi:hypothetical protein
MKKQDIMYGQCNFHVFFFFLPSHWPLVCTGKASSRGTLKGEWVPPEGRGGHERNTCITMFLFKKKIQYKEGKRYAKRVVGHHCKGLGNSLGLPVHYSNQRAVRSVRNRDRGGLEGVSEGSKFSSCVSSFKQKLSNSQQFIRGLKAAAK